MALQLDLVELKFGGAGVAGKSSGLQLDLVELKLVLYGRTSRRNRRFNWTLWN